MNLHKINSHLIEVESAKFSHEYFEDIDVFQFWLTIDLKPFDTGLKFENNPVKTEIGLDEIRLPVNKFETLFEKSFTLEPDSCEGSIYLGGAHNPVEIRNISFQQIDKDSIFIDTHLFLDFAYEKVAKSIAINIKFKADIDRTEKVIDYIYLDVPNQSKWWHFWNWFT